MGVEHFRAWCFTRWVLHKHDGEGAKLLERTLWFRSLSPISEGASTWKTGVQETALKKKFWFSTSLKKSLENIVREPGLESAQILSYGGREWTLSPFIWNGEKTNLPMILWIQSFLVWSSSLITWVRRWFSPAHIPLLSFNLNQATFLHGSKEEK